MYFPANSCFNCNLLCIFHRFFAAPMHFSSQRILEENDGFRVFFTSLIACAGITYSTKLTERVIIFLMRESERKSVRFRNSIAKCGECDGALGGMCYNQWRGQPDLVRFARHLSYRERVYSTINRVQ